MDLLKDKIDIEQVYAAVSANRHENTISCTKNYLLYSRSQCPVIHNLSSSKQVPLLLLGHTEEVNGQCFVLDSSSTGVDGDQTSLYVISSAYDKSALIWDVQRPTNNSFCDIKYKILHCIKSTNNEVFTTRCAFRSADNQFLSITSAIDGSIQLWLNSELAQTLVTKYCCFHSKLYTTRLGSKNFTFVFLAGGDNKIHVFQLNEQKPSLDHLFDLVGHTDWVKHLDIVGLDGRHLEFLLASASQDSYIRVWHMKLVDYEIDSTQIRTIASKPLSQQYDESASTRLTATLETVLSGHEGIIHGLCWFKSQSDSSLQLLSCSADKTLIIWKSRIAPIERTGERQQLNRYEQCPASAEIWKETSRLGETGETNLPFLGVCLSEDETTLYAQSLRGAIHSWTLKGNEWMPVPLITGHFEPVTDLSWEKSGAYLLSSSLDKTCRLHAIATSDNEWHEITRPQVHGHEINCLVSLNFGKFATGAEEKTIRTFEATQFFVRNFKHLSKASVPEALESMIKELPVHAQLPALGLSNRGAMSPYDIGDPNDKTLANTWYGISPLVERLAKVEHLDTLPIEEILLQSTLWWETNKIFGHGNELHALAVNSDGTFLASASKANRTDLANILVWESSKFRKVATIEHHSLTITRLRFSPDDKYLLSVSRDRTWCISKQTGQLRSAYKKLVSTSKVDSKHERIIWDCSWTYDSSHFVTVSRDKKAIIWSIDALVESPEKIDCLTAHQFNCSIQAIDSPSSQITASGYLFAFGLEDGSLELHLISNSQWVPLKSFVHLHHLPIRRLAFKPTETSATDLLLASAGDDCIVKLSKILVE